MKYWYVRWDDNNIMRLTTNSILRLKGHQHLSHFNFQKCNKRMKVGTMYHSRFFVGYIAYMSLKWEGENLCIAN